MKILIAGDGGQGVQTIAEILAQAAFDEGKKVSLIPNFGVEQRGGSSLAYLIIDKEAIVYPKFEKADWLIVLSEKAKLRTKSNLGPQTKTILGPAIKNGLITHLSPQVWNMLVLGDLVRKTQIVDFSSLIAALEKRLGQKFKENPKLRQLNLEAIKND